MSTPRTKQGPGVASPVAAGTLESWGAPVATGAVALLAAIATAFELVAAPVGLAVTIVGALAVAAEYGLAPASDARPGTAAVIAIGLAWIAVCYVPFHALLFPGAPLHAPIAIHGSATGLPITVPTGGRTAIDVALEAELPPNPGGGAALPVRYTVTLADSAGATTALSGRFDESLQTRRLGRRGTTKVLHAHHAARHLVTNPSGGDLLVTAVALDPSAGAAVTITALAHRLPPVPVLVVLAVLLLAAVLTLDARVVPASNGTLVRATGAALGTALMLWTSDTVHPTVSTLIGSVIFGGPIGLALGSLLWTIARRTLVHDGR